MFNKTNTNQGSDAQKRASLISSQKINGSVIKLPAKTTSETANNSFLNQAIASFTKLGLAKKATIVAIAIGTIPVLGIGAIAFSFANKSITKEITQSQQTEAIGLSDKVNRFMLGRYGDIQVISSLLFLTSPQASVSITTQDKQAILDGVIEAYKVYDSVAVFNRQGKLIVQSTGEPLDNQKDRTYFQEALQKDTPIISKPEAAKNTGVVSIYIAAPVKELRTGQTIGVVRARMPVKSLEEVIKNYVVNGQQYHLLDASGTVFLSPEKELLGKEAKAEYSNLPKLVAANKVDSFIEVPKTGKKEELVSYVPATKLDGLPDLNWQVLLSTDTAIVFEPQRQLLWIIGIGTAVTALIVAAIASRLAKLTTQPILNATAALAKLGQGKFNTRLEIEREDELGVLSANINQMAEQLQVLVKEQELDVEGAKLLTDITLRIRKTLKTEDIYRAAVKEVQRSLKTDRVIIYSLNQTNGNGVVVAESVTDNWPQMLGVKIDDPYFRERYVETDQYGHVQAIANIHQDQSLKNAVGYIQLLEKFAVKGNLIVPILGEGQLLSLLIAHQCETPRVWQQPEIDLFQQIATQIGYALEQAKLLEEIQSRNVTVIGSGDELHQQETLQQQLLQLLNEVEGAARGDLTVRADVTAGEIGTVADFFNSIVESLRDIVTQVQAAATHVNSAIGSNEGAIRHLAEEALTQAAEINRTLNAVDQMTLSMQGVAESAEKAAFVANHAAYTATKSGHAMDLTVQNILSLRKTVGETAKKVKRLGESSQQISRVVSLINQIAIQTNLLAINAGIEAARAGEEGQGFAVVAEEVGELAVRSAAATQEIEQIVENIQRETSEVVLAMEIGTTQVVEGTRIVEEAKQSLSEILDVSREIDSLVQSISTATASQVETSQSVSQLMKDIAAVSQRTSDSSRQVSESLQQTVEISHQLQETVEAFKVS
ncbi:methyl-accepting chemotaxis sensory transducer with phytochrome sensor [Nostoc commune NIES-4072]|uniref:Methyl-accepting chemotaxis sensory transducer with phytochrome sensor n=1 Tax=Nostoc commune NIES-4072 TaxID=2005467 RepID=A0A2R5FSK7_NOSCO|nr:methyl-accepting chemotaxis protein [Nostoc commune]BBD68550.1 methyl-accepting chemotaxis sensory transducer with phytochrome sensor [Nostoc commune HK-02]GBG20458.1 methyl-accepting chemotaxis sensory transducer with phytochrome sensor [Nostoc commune NIES-4072]